MSVVIPTFGDPVRLYLALRSVFSQSYQWIEVIVVDDNDSDSKARKNTEDINQNNFK